MDSVSVGVMFQRDVPPEKLAPRAQLLESLGFDDMWVVEDLFFSGGIAAAGAALAATQSLTIGIGILPAMVRNPVFTAMDLAALARLYPGRLVAGIGHGMQDWMARVGARPRSPMTGLEETLTVVRRLLDGESVTMQGRYVTVREARLEHVPAQRPPLLAGVRGPKGLALAGRLVDGAILAEPTSSSYTEWAHAQLLSNSAGETASQSRTLVSNTLFSINADAELARERIQPGLSSIPGGLSEPSVRSQLLTLDFADELIEVLDGATSQASLAKQLRPEWISELAVVGTPEDCARSIRKRQEAGADRIVLVPLLDRFEEQVTSFAEGVFPLLRSS